ncbi:hypothetical protein JK358_00950 [Nocardia sp. 2]|uniref:Uncharacterized protein n=1 Tax=Nocardia acididurans TaxID=2802282 RepID=A0ABS1LXA6_9NOCA|nr:DUF5361 domain-containing protein [Nocardia acididurans]MBL1072957.1 hypothetical protein [Nocardia acididurans]
MTWNDLKAVIRWSPASSALTLATRPEDHRWQLDQHLLADIADSLRWLAWSKTTDARNGRNMPQRIQRPGVKPTTERIGSATKLADMQEFLGW